MDVMIIAQEAEHDIAEAYAWYEKRHLRLGAVRKCSCKVAKSQSMRLNTDPPVGKHSILLIILCDL